MVRPSKSWTYDPFLALREAVHRDFGGKSRQPEEVAALDPDWERDVTQAWEWLKFHRDALKNPLMQD